MKRNRGTKLGATIDDDIEETAVTALNINKTAAKYQTYFNHLKIFLKIDLDSDIPKTLVTDEILAKFVNVIAKHYEYKVSQLKDIRGTFKSLLSFHNLPSFRDFAHLYPQTNKEFTV